MIVQSGLRKSMAVTWGVPGLFARADVIDNTSGTPALVATPLMAELPTVPGTYQGSFVPIPGKSYIMTGRVYTDNTYSTPDPNYSASSESFQCIDFGSGGGGGSSQTPVMRIVGVVTQSKIIGIIGA